MTPEKFSTDISLLAKIDLNSVEPEMASYFLKFCTPAFGELVRTANAFMNYVAANQEIFTVEEILAPTRAALEAAIFVSNCGRTYDWHYLHAGNDERAMMEHVAPAMQAAAIMAPRLASETSSSLKVINAALEEVNRQKIIMTQLSGMLDAPDDVLVLTDPLNAPALS